jgi:hypothetical protein
MLKTTERSAEMIKPREPPSWIPRIRANLEVRDRPPGKVFDLELAPRQGRRRQPGHGSAASDQSTSSHLI